jgi:hypothetical protein
MRFTKGFTYNNKPYGWNEGKLYRLPFCSNLRWYSLLECKPCLINNRRKGFILGSQRKSLSQIKEMTKDIDVIVDLLEKDGLPF